MFIYDLTLKLLDGTSFIYTDNHEYILGMEDELRCSRNVEDTDDLYFEVRLKGSLKYANGKRYTIPKTAIAYWTVECNTDASFTRGWRIIEAPATPNIIKEYVPIQMNTPATIYNNPPIITCDTTDKIERL